MNEFLFISQTVLIVLFALFALKLGKEALIAWIAIQAITANLFVLKQISLFGFNVTASDAFAIGSLLGLNLLQEYFGQQEARKATWICFFSMIFFALASQLHLLYQPSEFDTTHSAFLTLLSPTPRLLIASMGVFFIVQQIDIRFFSFLKRFFNNNSFAFRSGIALIFSQFLDTFLFSYAGLYGLVVSLADIILISFLIKLAVIGFFTTFIKLTRT